MTDAQGLAVDVAVKGLAGARAAGGPVSAGETYLVGEKGQELFTPSTSGTIIPNHELGGDQTVAMNYAPSFHVDNRADRGAAVVEMRKVAAESNKEMIERLKRHRVLPQ